MPASALAVDEIEILRAAAVGVLHDNDLGEVTRPSPTLYPHQWLWDSCFIAIGLRHLDPDRAAREVLSLFRGQWPNGMLPHVIFTETSGYYHAGPELWRSELVAATPGGVRTTGLTQPPMVAEAVVRVGECLDKDAREDFYRAAYPGLVRFHTWMYRERDPDDTGLVTLVHPWESGMDNSPPWMELTRPAAPLRVKALQMIGGEAVLDVLRRDSKEVPPEERLSGADLFTLYRIVRELRDASYDFRTIRAGEVPLMKDVAFNAILIRANHHLTAIAAAIGERLPHRLARAMRRTPAAFLALADGSAVRGPDDLLNHDARTGLPVGGATISGFLALYAGVLGQDEAASMAAALDQPRWTCAFGIASTPLDDPEFRPRCYWQGPVWVNMNWLIADGLERHGHPEQAARLRASTVAMVGRAGGMFEYHSPMDGAGVGSDHFSWTAALVLDMLAHKPVR